MVTSDLFEQDQPSDQSSSVADSLASTFLAPVIAPELKGPILDCGQSSLASFASFNPELCSWRMSQCSLFADSIESSQTWPRSGLMRNGTAYPLPPLVRFTREIGPLLWPTPTAGDAKASGSRNTPQSKANAGISLTDAVRMDGGTGRLSTMACARDSLQRSGNGLLSPRWVEWLMGFPPGWTELDASEMQSFRRLRKSSGARSSKAKADK